MGSVDMMNAIWTKEELKVLVRFYGSRRRMWFAARLPDRTWKEIRAKAEIHGLPRKKLNPALTVRQKTGGRRSAANPESIMPLYLEGESIRAIAKTLRCCPRTVRRKLRGLGLPTAIKNRGAAPERFRRTMSQANAVRFAATGFSSLYAVQAESRRGLARECGWPEDLNPRSVQTLNLLASSGRPMSITAIIEGIGANRKGMSAAVECGFIRKNVHSLIERGLVTRHRASHLGLGDGRRFLHTLGPEALRYALERIQQTEVAA